MNDLAYLSLTEVATLVEKRELSPVELTRRLLQRIDALDGRLHSYRTVLADRALDQARRAEQEIANGEYRGPLHGIPIAVKDLVYTKGVPTACGSTMLEDWLPDEDAAVMSRLEAAGAILLGKLHMTEFALRWHHPAWPMPVNPWGRHLVAGRLLERFRCGHGGRPVLRLARYRHGRLDSLSGSVQWRRRPETNVWPRQPSWRLSACRVAGQRRPHHTARRRCSRHVGGHRRP